MRPSGFRGVVVALFSVILAIAFLGCLGGDEGGHEEVLSSLTIDFMGERGVINPGHMTVWENVSGYWHLAVYPNLNMTEYVFLNISASNCLEQIERAGDLAGFEIEATYYSSFGSWIVNSVDGVENQVIGRGWQFWVNGEYAVEGADKVELVEGDQVTWKYASFENGGSSGA